MKTFSLFVFIVLSLTLTGCVYESAPAVAADVVKPIVIPIKSVTVTEGEHGKFVEDAIAGELLKIGAIFTETGLEVTCAAEWARLGTIPTGLRVNCRAIQMEGYSMGGVAEHSTYSTNIDANLEDIAEIVGSKIAADFQKQIEIQRSLMPSQSEQQP